MRKETTFEFFGLEIKSTQFSAVDGLNILFSKNEINPLVILSSCKIKVEKEFISMSNYNIVNKFLFDKAEIVPPTAVLRALLKLVDDFNFSFLPNWKSVSVPERFVSGARTVSSKATPSIIAQLIQDGVASKKELEEYYSLEDAFQMLDIMTAKGVNAALAAEAAERERNK